MSRYDDDSMHTVPASGRTPMLELRPISFREASAFISQHHRHHRPPHGCKFCIGLVGPAGTLVAVATVGRPVARALDDGYTAEVTRLCTDGTRNAASMLYAASWRAARAMGYRRMITYTLADEPGTSVRAAGWREIARTRGGSWNVPSRPRIDKHPIGPKKRYEVRG